MPAANTRAVKCGTKTRFETREQAVSARRWYVQQNHTDPAAIGAYACNHCDGFHIGHRRRPRRRS